MDWNEHAGTWDQEPGVRAYAAGVLARVAQAVGSHDALSELRVLDFGCGTGVLVEALAECCAEVVGLEPANKMLAVLQAKAAANGWTHVHPVLGTLEGATAHPQLQRPFDLVIASSVCAFVPDYASTVHALAGRLVPGGLLMQFDWERADVDDDEVGFTASEIRAALTAAGLEAVDVSIGFSETAGDMVMAPLLGTGRRPGSVG